MVSKGAEETELIRFRSASAWERESERESTEKKKCHTYNMYKDMYTERYISVPARGVPRACWERQGAGRDGRI